MRAAVAVPASRARTTSLWPRRSATYPGSSGVHALTWPSNRLRSTPPLNSGSASSVTTSCTASWVRQPMRAANASDVWPSRPVRWLAFSASIVCSMAVWKSLIRFDQRVMWLQHDVTVMKPLSRAPASRPFRARSSGAQRAARHRQLGLAAVVYDDLRRHAHTDPELRSSAAVLAARAAVEAECRGLGTHRRAGGARPAEFLTAVHAPRGGRRSGHPAG